MSFYKNKETYDFICFTKNNLLKKYFSKENILWEDKLSLCLIVILIIN